MAALLEQYRNVIIIALAALLAAALVVVILDRRDSTQPLEINLAETTPGPIEVYITGAVAQPGVYEMQEGDRVVDLLYEAGGQAPDADLEAVNLALRLHDEDQVLIPHMGQTTSAVAGVVAPRIDINTATAAELDDLPGIGEVYSQRIVESRIGDGPYVTADELVERRIIPGATLERIRELITVGP